MDQYFQYFHAITAANTAILLVLSVITMTITLFAGYKIFGRWKTLDWDDRLSCGALLGIATCVTLFLGCSLNAMFHKLAYPQGAAIAALFGG